MNLNVTKSIRVLLLTQVFSFLFYSCQSVGQEVQNVVIQEEANHQKVFTTKELISAFLNNKNVDTLKGRQIMVTGFVSDISPDNYRVLIQYRGDKYGIICVLKDKAISNQIKIGDNVVFQGMAIGFLGSYVHIKDCNLISE